MPVVPAFMQLHAVTLWEATSHDWIRRSRHMIGIHTPFLGGR